MIFLEKHIWSFERIWLELDLWPNCELLPCFARLCWEGIALEGFLLQLWKQKYLSFQEFHLCPDVFYITSPILTWIGQNEQEAKKVDGSHSCRRSDPKTISGYLAKHLNIWNSHRFVICIRIKKISFMYIQSFSFLCKQKSMFENRMLWTF